MLKNRKIGSNWIFQITIEYDNWIFLIPVVLSLVGFFCCRCSCCYFLELKTTEGSFFQRVHLYIWAVAVHDLVTLSIRAQSFNG